MVRELQHGDELPGRHADGSMGHGWRYPRPGRLRQRRNHRLWRVATEQRPLVRSQRGERRDAGQRRGLGSVRGLSDCGPTHRASGAGPMQLNVWRPSNGVWYYGRSFAGTGGTSIRVWHLRRYTVRAGYGRRRRRRLRRFSSVDRHVVRHHSGFLHYLGTAGGYPGPPFGRWHSVNPRLSPFTAQRPA